MFFFILQPLSEAFLFSNSNNELYDLSNTLKNDYEIHGNIASANSNDEWWSTMVLSYYLNSKYYGLTKAINNSTSLQRELENDNIDYYFVWNNKSIPKLSDYTEITDNKIDGLKIYSRIKK